MKDGAVSKALKNAEETALFLFSHANAEITALHSLFGSENLRGQSSKNQLKTCGGQPRIYSGVQVSLLCAYGKQILPESAGAYSVVKLVNIHGYGE